MARWWSVAGALLAVLAIRVPAAGQLVQGTITDRMSGDPVAGVLVTLERIDSVPTTPAAQRTVLTAVTGRYAIRAAGPGVHRVTAKRIGVRRFESAALHLAGGETTELDIVLEAVAQSLPEVTVRADELCAVRPAEGPRVAALWDEIRTALAAEGVTRRDSLFDGRVVRYARALVPSTLRSLGETRQRREIAIGRPFFSVSADSLAMHGYWRAMEDDTIVFHGPDAEVLLSPSFRRDHCFDALDGRGNRAGLAGLSFEPVKARDVPDVRGTIWLDARSFELRFVEFRYTRLPPVRYSDRAGGEVHFARLPNGGWIVLRWFIRMPEYAVVTRRAVTSNPASAPGNRRPFIERIVEEGGDVVGEGIRSAERPASLRGTLVDSAGRPFTSGRVSLTGTRYVTIPDASGRFVLDGVPPGLYGVHAEHAAYAALGIAAAEDEVMLQPGAAERISLRGRRSEEMASALCGGVNPVADRSTLRVTLVDGTSGQPLTDAAVRLYWEEQLRPSDPDVPSYRFAPNYLHGTTDRDGVIVFCALPAGVGLQLGLPLDEARMRLLAMITLDRRELRVEEVRVP